MSLSLYRAKSPLLGQHSNNAASVMQDSQSDQFSNAESASFIISLNGLLDDHYLWKIKTKCLKLELLNWSIWEALLDDFFSHGQSCFCWKWWEKGSRGASFDGRVGQRDWGSVVCSNPCKFCWCFYFLLHPLGGEEFQGVVLLTSHIYSLGAVVSVEDNC